VKNLAGCQKYTPVPVSPFTAAAVCAALLPTKQLFDSPARKEGEAEKKYDDTLVALSIALGTLLFAAPLPQTPTSLRFPFVPLCA
jgi:hypothetical protein